MGSGLTKPPGLRYCVACEVGFEHKDSVDVAKGSSGIEKYFWLQYAVLEYCGSR